MSIVQIALLLAHFLVADRNTAASGSAQSSVVQNVIATLLDLLSKHDGGFVPVNSVENLVADLEHALQVASPFMSGGGASTVGGILKALGAGDATVTNVLSGQIGEVCAIGGSYNGRPDFVDVYATLRSAKNALNEAVGVYVPANDAASS